MRILVVDDDEAIRELLQVLLQHADHEVECACGGGEALARLSRDPRPELILLDLMMPEISGWQVLEALETSQELSAIPVVVLTAYDARADLPAGRPSLHKPLDPDVLLDLVSTVSAAARGENERPRAGRSVASRIPGW